jgi:hypothetical protein
MKIKFSLRVFEYLLNDLDVGADSRFLSNWRAFSHNRQTHGRTPRTPRNALVIAKGSRL